MKRNYTKSDYSESWSENGIVFQIISPKVKKINLLIAQQLVADRQKAMGTIGIDVLVFVEANNAISIDNEAKKFYKQSYAYRNIIAIAMLVDNYPARLIGNIVFKINKPDVPTALFNNKSKAFAWLKQFQNLN